MLGKEVRSIVTGFKGVATSKVTYINGCIQFCVKPRMKDDGLMPEGHYIDVEELEVIGEGVKVTPTATGGDRKEAPKR